MLPQDRALSYIFDATGLRSIQRLYQKLCMFYWRVASLFRERNLSRRWRNFDRRHSLAVDQRWFQNAGRVYFKTDLSLEESTNYQNTHGWPKTLIMYFLSHCWRLSFILLFLLGYEKREELLQSPPGTPLVCIFFSIAISFIHLLFFVTTIMFE